MLLARGCGGDTALTRTIFGREEQAPTYRGAPNEDIPYVWVYDEFYEVGSGGSETEIDGQTIRVAFDIPLPRGFGVREQALSATREHVRAQLARVDVLADEVQVGVVRSEEKGMLEAGQPVPTDHSADEGSPEGNAPH